eukprot:5658062-Pyramimonas_sp.AAC.1
MTWVILESTVNLGDPEQYGKKLEEQYVRSAKKREDEEFMGQVQLAPEVQGGHVDLTDNGLDIGP